MNGYEKTIVATDYSDKNNWMFIPDYPTKEVDIIYFLPTAWFRKEGEPLVCEVTHEGMRSRGRAIYKLQASAFEQAGNMFAPFYRQYDAVALVGCSNEQLLAAESNEPKIDCFAALDYYFEHLNNNRPYILCGHSQGAVMLNFILGEYMKAHPDYYENMIAAYMLGYAATKGWLAENPHIKMAQCADDIGVVVSWNVEGPGNKNQYSIVCPEGAISINPLNWKIDETYAGVEENLGSLILTGEGTAALKDGVADAQLDLERGVVVCKSVLPERFANPLAAPLFGTESYHQYDYGFYYMNLKENAKARIDAFNKLKK